MLVTETLATAGWAGMAISLQLGSQILALPGLGIWKWRSEPVNLRSQGRREADSGAKGRLLPPRVQERNHGWLAGHRQTPALAGPAAETLLPVFRSIPCPGQRAALGRHGPHCVLQ